MTQPARPLLANRIRQSRLDAGLTRRACAQTAHVSEPTWGRWESGAHAPTPDKVPRIARALGVSLEALFLPDGWRAVTAVNLTPEAVDRVRSRGLPEAEGLATLVAAQLPSLILEACRPSANPKRGTRAKPRRTRAEVLAGIAEANRMRADAQAQPRQIALSPLEVD